jgi:3-deoxy-D-manno-octulosonic-acid transferase
MKPKSKKRIGLHLWCVYCVEQIAAHVLLPVLCIWMILRSMREPAYLVGLASRFGFGPSGRRNSIWVYAASLGETRAASPLVSRLLSEGHSIVLTHQTATGLKEGRRLFGDNPNVTVRYVPLDLFWAVWIFLFRARPRLGIVLEIEIWPAMLLESARFGLPMILANGNLLEKALEKKKGLSRLVFGFYRLFDRIFTRDKEYLKRYVRIGVPEENIRIVGELRYDLNIPHEQLDVGQKVRTLWANSDPVLLIASSVKDEEPDLIDMVQTLLARVDRLRIVWVPRSPQRFDAVFQKLESLGIVPIRRSSLDSNFGGRIDGAARVLLGDSIGEMFIYCSMADLVFVGASLCDHGGHNIIEPMAVGRPVVMGPSIYGVAFAASHAKNMGAFRSLSTVAELTEAIESILQSKQQLDRMSKAAAEFASQRTGAAERTVADLADLLGSSTQHIN